MARTGKPRRSDEASGRQVVAGAKGGRPDPPLAVESEQIRETEESRRAARRRRFEIREKGAYRGPLMNRNRPRRSSWRVSDQEGL